MSERDALVDEFLAHAVLRYSGEPGPDPAHFQKAAAILDAHPWLTRASIHTATVSGDLGAIEQWLDADPTLLEAPAGDGAWTPLMFAAYARLPGVSTLEAGRLLLARGADPNAFELMNGRYRFTVLTGVFGEGEAGPQRQPPHPDQEAFARLLLESGADPNDSQAAYNQMFTPGDRCLELLIEHGLSATAGNAWTDEPPHLAAGSEPIFSYQLAYAIRHGHASRARLLIRHGADPNRRTAGRTPYQLASLYGETALVELLLAHGAEPDVLGPIDAFVSACMRADRAEVTGMRAVDPGIVEQVMQAHPRLLHDAVVADRRDAVEVMLTAGIDPNHLSRNGALHEAAWHGRIEMLQLLIENGADPTLRDLEHAAPALGWALFNGQDAAARFLDDCEMDVFTAVARSSPNALRERLSTTPQLIEQRFRDLREASGADTRLVPHELDWMTPLAFAVHLGRAPVVELLLELGADPDIGSGDGLSLAALARERGHTALLPLLAAATRGDQG